MPQEGISNSQVIDLVVYYDCLGSNYQLNEGFWGISSIILLILTFAWCFKFWISRHSAIPDDRVYDLTMFEAFDRLDKLNPFPDDKF